MKKEIKTAIGLRAILPPNKVMKSGKDYNRKSAKSALRKEVNHVA